MKKAYKLKNKKRLAAQLPLHLMMLIPIVLVAIYSYGPMIGLVMSFQNFVPSNKGFFYSLFVGNEWVGFDVFRYIFQMPDFWSITLNTIIISLMKLVAKIVFPLIFALLLNELVSQKLKKLVQSFTFLPYFLSWVVMGGILLEIFSPQTGIINSLIKFFGGEPIFFFGVAPAFPFMLTLTEIWKEIGFNTIIFLAGLTSIDPTLYEAAAIDGASRWKQTLHISIPSLQQIAILLLVLGMGGIMNAGLDQIYMLYSPAVYSTGDVIDTYTFRMGIQGGQYALSSAVGLFKSVVSLILMGVTNFFATKFSDHRIL